ncbi:hypothetical protein [Planococcus alpniumensis]
MLREVLEETGFTSNEKPI